MKYCVTDTCVLGNVHNSGDSDVRREVTHNEMFEMVVL